MTVPVAHLGQKSHIAHLPGAPGLDLDLTGAPGQHCEQPERGTPDRDAGRRWAQLKTGYWSSFLGTEFTISCKTET